MILELGVKDRVTVTGAGGYIGSALVELLIAKSFKVTRVSRKPLAPILGVEDIVGDLNNTQRWSQIVENSDTIFHLSGNTSIDFAKKHPSLSSESIVGPIHHLIEATKDKKSKPRIVFTSTATIYGIVTSLPVDEKFESNPTTLYDLHKLFAEKLLMYAHEKEYVDSVVLRFANVYGPSKSMNFATDRGILNKIALKALSNEEICIYGEGSFIRDYIYIQDILEALILSGTTPKIGGNIYNIGSGEGTSILSAFTIVAREAQRFTSHLANVLHVDWPQNSEPIDSRNYIADTSQFFHATGWMPKISLPLGIELTVSDLNKKIELL